MLAQAVATMRLRPQRFGVRTMKLENDLNSWEEFLAEINSLNESFGEKADYILYRGQTCSCWKLETTLERKLKTPISLSRYYRFAYSAKTRIETFVDTFWDIPTPVEYKEWLEKKDILSFSPFPGYDYLAYLRHHGFPSPFLDWTASPYVAAFFAFNNCGTGDGSVSIYCYLEHSGVGKTHSSDEPGIYTFGPYVKAHKRHVLQQSQYSICVELDDDYNPIYANHEIVLNKNEDSQDKLWKFNIPNSERTKVIKMLNKMNINAFSLFGTEDSLIESISTNEIIKNRL
jgi:hypothetical protein